MSRIRTRTHLAAAAVIVAGLLGAGMATTGAVAQDSGIITLPSQPKQQRSDDDNTVTVPGTVDRPVAPPDGDFRTPDQRRRDARAFDRCINKASARESDADRSTANPVSADPTEYCRSRLGMSNRNDIPSSRLRRQ